jgi:hypothetical protein
MNETVVTEPALPGVFARAIGIITSPKATFEAIVRAPKVLGILALLALLTGASQSAMSFTKDGQQAMLDFQIQQMTKMGMTVTPEAEERMATGMAYAKYTSFVTAFIFYPIGLLILAGILYAVFNAIMGGTADFKQIMAVCAHNMVIATMGAIFTTSINMMKGTMSVSAANLGQFLPMLREGSFAATFLGGIDLFRIWSIITLSIGLGVLYKRKSGNIAIGLFIVYAIIMTCVALFFSSRG